jgi:very-short-patch-repair endonuclease
MLITCQICGFISESLTSHIRVHKIRVTEYKQRYPGCSLVSEEVSRKRRDTNIIKYGCENVSQNKNILDKKRSTWLKKYGVTHPLKSSIVKSKRDKTVRKRFGVSNVSQSSEVKAKKEASCNLHYGVSNPQKSKVVQKKTRKTCQNRYGVDYYLGSVESMTKRRQTCLDKYGVMNPMQNPDIAYKNFISGVRGLSGLEELVESLNIPGLEFCSHKIAIRFPNGKVKYPDFIFVGTHKVIEVNGYFHYPKFTGVSNKSHEDYLTSSYYGAGYDCLVIWDTEIESDLSEVMQKILTFKSSEAIR